MNCKSLYLLTGGLSDRKYEDHIHNPSWINISLIYTSEHTGLRGYPHEIALTSAYFRAKS